MTGEKDTGQGGLKLPLTPDQRNFYEQGFSLGLVMEQRLGVPLGRLIHPQDLALSGLAVYAAKECQTTRLGVDVLTHVRNVAGGYAPAAFQKAGATPEQLIQRYPALIGNGDYAKGEIAEALRTASSKLTPQEIEQLEREFAMLFARMVKAQPESRTTVITEPGVKIDIVRQHLNLGGRQQFPLDQSPNVVVEYGPGIAGARKIPDEVKQIPQNIYIEHGIYANQTLVFLAALYGLVSPRGGQFIGREDGIAQAGAVFLQMGAADQIDIVTASMVHAAGEKELTTGIRKTTTSSGWIICYPSSNAS